MPSSIRAPRTYRFTENKDTVSNPQPNHRELWRTGTNAETFTFTENKTGKDFVLVSVDKDHSRKRKSLQKHTNTFPRKLSKRRPVKTYVPIDAWILIFRRSHPSFLFQARLVCREFRDILLRESIWLSAREFTFEQSVPPCPPNISEFQYAKLLVGRGCQIQPCHRRETRKCYWPFMIRACEQCLDKTTMSVSDANHPAEIIYRKELDTLPRSTRFTVPNTLADLLPAYQVWQNRWLGPRKLDESSTWLMEGNECRILTREYQTLCDDFTSNLTMSHFWILTWIEKHWNATQQRMNLAEHIRAPGVDVLRSREVLRQEKELYFITQANRLNPSMVSTQCHRPSFEDIHFSQYLNTNVHSLSRS